jgi:hypothetical protein
MQFVEEAVLGSSMNCVTASVMRQLLHTDHCKCVFSCRCSTAAALWCLLLWCAATSRPADTCTCLRLRCCVLRRCC